MVKNADTVSEVETLLAKRQTIEVRLDEMDIRKMLSVSAGHVDGSTNINPHHLSPEVRRIVNVTAKSAANIDPNLPGKE
jgi:hypothetical protein